MTIVLDAGALIALDRDERPMWVRLKAAKSRGDVIDAAVVVIAHDGDDIITSDPEDLRPLAAQARATSS